MAGLHLEQLEQVRDEANVIVTKYNVLKDDPIEALETGVGNCFAKAVLAAGIISVRYGTGDTIPAGVFSRRLHAAEKPSDFGGPIKANRAHYALLIPDSEQLAQNNEWGIFGLDFGIDGREDSGDITNYNEVGDAVYYAESAGIIKATPLFRDESYMFVSGWRDSANTYLKMIADGPRDINGPMPELPFEPPVQDQIDYERMFNMLAERPELEL